MSYKYDREDDELLYLGAENQHDIYGQLQLIIELLELVLKAVVNVASHPRLKSMEKIYISSTLRDITGKLTHLFSNQIKTNN